MKLFLREHVWLIVIQCVQFLFFCLIMFLSGFKDISILLYAVLIGFSFLISYMGIHYYNRRQVYQKLSSRPTHVEELLEYTNKAPLGTALDKWAKAQYRLLMEQLKEAEDAQVNHLKFIDRWVHQMKTPLSVIELTAQELDEPESSNIREETERIKNGLHTVLYMARMRTIQEDFQIKPVQLERLVHDVNQENKRFYIRNQVYPHLHIKTKNITVATDEKWLFFIIDQILQNAVKYSAGKSNRIDISIDKKEKEAVIEIADFGVGIPAHDIKRIFQAFYTGDNGRKFRESTGMGLHLTKEVADYLGHVIEVESAVNIGTTFRIHFSETQTLN